MGSKAQVCLLNNGIEVTEVGFTRSFFYFRNMVSRFFSYIRDRHDFIFKLGLLLLSVFFILLFLPKEGKFKYEFKKNKPWVHEDLFAPFDFAINKTPEEITVEKQYVEENHLIYFNIQREKERDALIKYKNWIEENWNRHQVAERDIPAYLNYGVKYLQAVFEVGIIEMNDQIERKDRTSSVLVMDEDNIGEEIEIGALYTLADAYEEISNTLVQEFMLDANFLMLGVEYALQHNVIYNAELTEKDLQNELDNISLTHGGVLKDEKIISSGEIVTKKKYMMLQSLKDQYELKLGASRQSIGILIGQTIIVLLIFYALFLFLRRADKHFFEETKNILLIAIVLVGFVGITTFLTQLGVSVYLIPFCVIPLLIRTFYGNRMALFVYLVALLLVSFIVPNSSEFLVIELVTGIVVLYTVLQVNKRAELFYTASIIFLLFSLSYLAFLLMQDGNFYNFSWITIRAYAINAGLTLLTYPLIFLFEKLFGFISDVTLLELADTNNKLLRALNEKAPGTFQHSLQVSNLAEEAIREIGGNSLLVRTGALYHDIGKMTAPAYFIENQSGVNPHDELGYEESAGIIIDHVIKGIELAKKYNLPEQIIDFIRTHHGTTTTEYFFRKYQEESLEQEVDKSMFQYAGPKPYSKETAVLMMADSVEAASRSLKEYNEKTIGRLIDGVIDAQISQEQFVYANITFKDITTVKKLFLRKLLSMYHVRVEYPK